MYHPLADVSDQRDQGVPGATLGNAAPTVVIDMPASTALNEVPKDRLSTALLSSNDNVSNERVAGGMLCRICNADEAPESLIAPCECSGSLRYVHTYCLQQWISTRPASADAAPGDPSRMQCEICHTPYQIQMTYLFHFSCQTCCHATSLGHVFEMVVLVLMLAVCASLWPLLRRRKDSEHGFDSITVIVVALLMVVLTLLTMVKVVRRYAALRRGVSCILI